MAKTKYNHAFTIGFTVVTPKEGEQVSGHEMLIGLLRRLANLVEEDPTLEMFTEAIGLPFDTYEEE